MSRPQSSYLPYLPAIYQDNPFLDNFLLAFEQILTRGGPESGPALAEVIAGIDRYFRPLAADGAAIKQAPAEFLPWLAGWVSFSLREDWDEATRRRYLSEIVSLYRRRGTKVGLQRMLQIYLGEETPITIYESAADFKKLAGGFDPPPHFFLVEISEKDRDPAAVRHKERVALAIIEQEKPAHTIFALRITIPTMRLLSPELARELQEKPLILGTNTLLGVSAQRLGKPFVYVPPLALPFTLDEKTQLGTTPP